MLKPEDLVTMSERDLIVALKAHQATNPHLSAQIAYALAFLMREQGKVTSASVYKAWSLRLLGKRTYKEGDTLEACVTECPSILGFPIPQIFHEDVVRRDLKDIPD